MKLDDIKEQKIMSTELKRMNSAIKLLYVIISLLCISLFFQTFLIKNFATQSDVAVLKNEISEVKKKVHFRYFNLTNSLEDIHKVIINTENGRIKR